MYFQYSQEYLSQKVGVGKMTCLPLKINCETQNNFENKTFSSLEGKKVVFSWYFHPICLL